MIINKFAKWMLCAGLAAAAGTVEAGPIEFDFKDPKKVNNALFLLDAPLESISGTAKAQAALFRPSLTNVRSSAA